MSATLVPDGHGQMTDGAHAYRIPGYPHLRVEPCYDNPDDLYDGRRRAAHLYAWIVADERFPAGTDRYRRRHVVMTRNLSGIRSWVRAGGPALWDPERRVQDRTWWPVPDDPYVAELLQWGRAPK